MDVTFRVIIIKNVGAMDEKSVQADFLAVETIEADISEFVDKTLRKLLERCV